MTIEQAAIRLQIAPEKLQCYKEMGLFDCCKQPDGTIDYCDALLELVRILPVLLRAGTPVEGIRDFMRRLMQSEVPKGEKVAFLRQQRQRLLDDIHTKQKSLDQLDYIIYETLKRPGAAQSEN